MEPDLSVLRTIGFGKPIAFDELIELWYRTQDYIILETIVDIACQRFIPLWAAEQAWRQEWAEYNKRDQQQSKPVPPGTKIPA